MGDLNLDALLVTEGEEGMTLFRRSQSSIKMGAEARQVYDVTVRATPLSRHSPLRSEPVPMSKPQHVLRTQQRDWSSNRLARPP
jgi:hypothetical protein